MKKYLILALLISLMLFGACRKNLPESAEETLAIDTTDCKATVTESDIPTGNESPTSLPPTSSAAITEETPDCSETPEQTDDNRKDVYNEYSKIVRTIASAKDISYSILTDMKVEAFGNEISGTSLLSVKAVNRGDNDERMSVERSNELLGEKTGSYAYYEDGIGYYTDSKTSYKVEVFGLYRDILSDFSDFFVLTEKNFDSFEMGENDDGTKTLTFTLDMENTMKALSDHIAMPESVSMASYSLSIMFGDDYIPSLASCRLSYTIKEPDMTTEATQIENVVFSFNDVDPIPPEGYLDFQFKN